MLYENCHMLDYDLAKGSVILYFGNFWILYNPPKSFPFIDKKNVVIEVFNLSV